MGIEKGFCAACEKADKRLVILSTDYKCLDCGGEFKADFNVDDDVWEKIKPAGKPWGAGLLCGRCITSRLEAKGYGAFRITSL